MKLEYAIRNKKTGRYYEHRAIEIDINDVLDGARERLTAPANLDMEDEWEFCDFEVVSD